MQGRVVSGREQTASRRRIENERAPAIHAKYITDKRKSDLWYGAFVTGWFVALWLGLTAVLWINR